MVKFQETGLDRTFAALADPTRRALVARLGEQGNMTVSDLARPFPVSLPAIMKHLDVLSEAGLITRTKTGRSVTCQLATSPMEDAMNWLNHYLRFWSNQLDRLTAFVEQEPCSPNRAPSPIPASPSSVASPRRRKKSMPHGRSPRS